MNKAFQMTKYIVSKVLYKLHLNIPTDTLLSVIILSLVLASLAVNFYNKIQEGRSSYDVYLAELGALDKLKQENDLLKKDLNYFESIEYKLVYVRDSLNTVRHGEKLYQLAEDVKIYDVVVDEVDIYKQLDPAQIWKSLLLDSLI